MKKRNVGWAVAALAIAAGVYLGLCSYLGSVNHNLGVLCKDAGIALHEQGAERTAKFAELVQHDIQSAKVRQMLGATAFGSNPYPLFVDGVKSLGYPGWSCPALEALMSDRVH